MHGRWKDRKEIGEAEEVKGGEKNARQGEEEATM